MTDLNHILKSIGISNPPQCWVEYWQEAERAYPGNSFVTPDLVDVAAKSTDLDPGLVELLRETVSAIRADDDLLRLAWLWHFVFFDKDAGGASAWPEPNALPIELRGMFAPSVLITGLPKLLEMHKRMGIPEQVTRDTLFDIALWADDYRSKHGKWGLSETGWLQNHFAGRLFRLGRLEFIPITYARDYRIYRGKRDGAVLALAESGIKFRRDGKVDGTNGITDPEAWQSVLEIGDGFVKGNPISSDGIALQQTVEIKISEWDLLLEKGTKLLDVHIPAGSKLDRQACIDSYRTANDFYPRFFPEHKYTGFICFSWLLDPELGKILPTDSNIVQFQREFYLLPALSNDRQIFERVFGGRPEDLSKAPRDSALRRAILDHVLAGNRMSNALGFIPADEIGSAHHYYNA